MKPANIQLRDGFHMDAHGVSFFSGATVYKTKLVRVGFHYVFHDGPYVKEYAKGHRVVIKVYMKGLKKEDKWTEKQRDTTLREVMIWLKLKDLKGLFKWMGIVVRMEDERKKSEGNSQDSLHEELRNEVCL